MSAVGVLLGQ